MPNVFSYRYEPSLNRKRWARRLVAIVTGGLLIGVCVRYWHSALQLAVIRYEIWQSSRFEMPAEAIALDTTSAGGDVLIAGSRAYHRVVDPTMPRYLWPTTYEYAPLVDIAQSMPNPNRLAICAQSVIFLHERTSAAGHRRLVVVSLPSDFDFTFQREVLIPSVGLAGWPKSAVDLEHFPDRDGMIWYFNHMSLVLEPDLAPFQELRTRTPDEEVRIFFGQIDSQDASRFTIKYDIGNQSGIINGQLKDDDTVTLTANGPRAAKTLYPPQNPNQMPLLGKPALSVKPHQAPELHGTTRQTLDPR
jgi:hypothetical protein